MLCTLTGHLTSVEIDPALAELLRERFADVATVDIVDGDATDLDFPDGKLSGAACFTMLHHVPTAASQDRLFTEVARVLRPGAAMVAGDSLAGDGLAAMHDGDTYNPVNPQTLPPRLAAVGFIVVEWKTTNLIGQQSPTRRDRFPLVDGKHAGPEVATQ